MRAWRILGLTLAITALVAPGLYAQYNNRYMQLSYLTFSAPFQVPGATLPAGTYRFQMAPIVTGKTVVQILSKNGEHVYASFIARQVHKVAYEAPLKTVVMFAERPAGVPQAVKEWFYPGDSFGEEFVYPKSTAVQIARANHTTVPAIENESAKDLSTMKSATIGRVNEKGILTSTPQAAQNEPPATLPAEGLNQIARHALPSNANPTASPQPRESVGTSGQAAAAPQARATTGTRRLPQTASDLPLIALLSAVTISASLGIGLLRRCLA